jgi:hypothetical protein
MRQLGGDEGDRCGRTGGHNAIADVARDEMDSMQYHDETTQVGKQARGGSPTERSRFT